MQKSSSALFLSGCVLLSMACGIGISLLINHFFELMPLSGQADPAPSQKYTDHWYVRMCSNGIEHAFTFLVPAIFFWYVFENRTWEDFSAKRLYKVSSAWMSVAIVLVLIPLNQIIIDFNQHIQFPGILKEVESWMRAMEQEKSLLTQKFLQISSFSELLVALIVFGLVGPFGEEVFFRGVLQQKLKDWGLSTAKSIWVAAIIFSLIHFQFYGFLPRMLMGVLFGYLFLWSGNIWVPILAHVVNNGLFVLHAFIQQNRPSMDKYIELFAGNRIFLIVAFIISPIVLFYFRKQNLTYP